MSAPDSAPSRGLSVLFIAGRAVDPEAVERVLRTHLPGAAVHRTESLQEARAALRRGTFDVILADHAPPDAGGIEWLEALREDGNTLPVVVLGRAADQETAVGLFRAGAADYVRIEAGDHAPAHLPIRLLEACRQAGARPDGGADLDAIREAVIRVHHDVNNPLSIISGNAQLLLELARVMEVDPELMQPIRDIEEASRRLADTLRRLAELRRRLGP